MNEEIALLLSAEPFVPFNFVLNSGDRYTVSNPDLVIVAEIAFLYAAKSDRRDVLRLNQIAALEVLDPAMP